MILLHCSSSFSEEKNPRESSKKRKQDRLRVRRQETDFPNNSGCGWLFPLQFLLLDLPFCFTHSDIGNSAYARLSGCPDIQSRRAASIRDCQPAPVDLKYSTTSDDKRMAVGILVVSAFGLPGLRTTFATAKKFCT
jgi:hypothetical protein